MAPSEQAAEAEAADSSVESKALEEAEEQLKELADLDDYYFGADKEEKRTALAGAATACIDRVLSSSTHQQRNQRVKCFSLKGRVLSLLPGEERKAEEFLSKAIKLDPLCLDAWNVLGEVYWNLQDLPQAKQCFEQAIELCGANATSLRNLSMVLRAVDGAADCEGDAEKAAVRSGNYAKALKCAKDAVALDMVEPQNWETLGNSYMGDFFVNGKQADAIKRALVAYEKADVSYDKLGKRNPTLHVNRGNAAKYLEDYELAMRAFQKASEIGAPGAADLARGVLELVQKLVGYAERKSEHKGRRLKELLADFPAGPERGLTLAELRANPASKEPLAAKVVALVDRQGEVPAIAACCDASGEFFALSIYNAEPTLVAGALVPMKSLLKVQRPHLRVVSVTGPDGRVYSYPRIHVAHPGDVIVVGSGSLGSTAVKSVFSTVADRATTAA